MKAKYIIFTLLSLVFAACGGGDDDEVVTSTEYLNVPSQIAIAGDGTQKGQLQISADCAWTVSGAPSWMSLSSNSGSGSATVEITCTPNPSAADERSAVLNVISASGKIKKPVTVVQSIANENITPSTNELAFTSDGGSKALSIQSNTSWRISGIEDWLTLSKDAGTGNAELTVMAKRNDGEAARTATLTIQGNNTARRIAVRQEGHVFSLSLSPTEVKATATAATYNLVIDGDATWAAAVNVDWCTLGKLNGIGSDNLTVAVQDNMTQNPRTATITLTTSKTTLACTLTQVAAQVPSVSAVTVSNIDKYSFTASATYTSDFEVTECGYCYSHTNATPTISDTVVKSESLNGVTITGLTSARTYYIRAYAKSAVGIGYGEVKAVTTKGAKPGEDDNGMPSV